MGSVSPAFTFLLMIFSGWVHREQLIVVEYLQAETQTKAIRARISPPGYGWRIPVYAAIGLGDRI